MDVNVRSNLYSLTDHTLQKTFSCCISCHVTPLAVLPAKCKLILSGSTTNFLKIPPQAPNPIAEPIEFEGFQSWYQFIEATSSTRFRYKKGLLFVQSVFLLCPLWPCRLPASEIFWQEYGELSSKIVPRLLSLLDYSRNLPCLCPETTSEPKK